MTTVRDRGHVETRPSVLWSSLRSIVAYLKLPMSTKMLLRPWLAQSPQGIKWQAGLPVVMGS